MKMIIEGREYQVVDHHTGQILHMMELQQQGRDLVDGGLGMSALQRMEREAKAYNRAVAAYEKALADGAEDVEEPLVPDAALTMMAVAIFLSRRAAGDAVSFREALQVGMSTIVQVPEPTDRPASDDEPDPTTPGDGGPATPGDDAPAAAATPPRSRTSRSRSAGGSPSSPTGGRRSARRTSSASS